MPPRGHRPGRLIPDSQPLGPAAEAVSEWTTEQIEIQFAKDAKAMLLDELPGASLTVLARCSYVESESDEHK